MLVHVYVCLCMFACTCMPPCAHMCIYCVFICECMNNVHAAAYTYGTGVSGEVDSPIRADTTFIRAKDITFVLTNCVIERNKYPST